MLRVLFCLTGAHDWRLVVLAGVVCFLTSLAAVSIGPDGEDWCGRGDSNPHGVTPNGFSYQLRLSPPLLRAVAL